ncbi:hypothetical protein F5B22DRAFT_626635 [Xylaria bambusicola]|uniref:uncharacterized protein n=1 Tax=Xylaria bambusicola TaxID=326684 RepID=UPI0020081201|nr:uncharacterized protein F5B22DRAFT_626635 [Xylaria bambusicola]KAI0505735.1 hypothetical protein F5B22DRAFT_626635 [Xylaria bambusicola]
MWHGSAFPLAWLRQSHQRLCLCRLSRLSPQRTIRLSYAHQTSTRQVSTRAMATASDEQKAPLEERTVAGSFLFKIPNGDDKQAKVALFRRSSKVRTYQHKLAPCSGSVEESDASPLDAALREIREETTLPASSLDLLRVGKPYSFVDESIGRKWNINPFAFRLKDVAEGGKGEEGITLDWEHEGIEWFDPLQVSGSEEFGGVPRLIDSLRRVWPEYDLGSDAGRILTEGLQRLRDDREHGARELAGVAVLTLRDVVRQMLLSHAVDESSWAKVRMAAWHLCQARPAMGAAITTAILKALDAIKAAYVSDMVPANKAEQVIQALEQQLAHRNATTDRICQTFSKFIRDLLPRGENPEYTLSILTLSSSSTMSSCLSHAISTVNIKFDLRILESRPLFEGVTFASRILKDSSQHSNFKVTLYSDASAALAAENTALILLGADRISSAGDVNNKIGSFSMVLSANCAAPDAFVAVLSDTEKIAGPGAMEEHSAEENSHVELSSTWKGAVEGAQVIEDALSRDDPRIAVKNAYFEWVPAEFVDFYLTEEGDWLEQQVQQRSQWIGYEFDQYFNGL